MRVADAENILKDYKKEQVISIIMNLKNIEDNCHTILKNIENIINLENYDFKESVIVFRRKDEDK